MIDIKGPTTAFLQVSEIQWYIQAENSKNRLSQEPVVALPWLTPHFKQKLHICIVSIHREQFWLFFYLKPAIFS